MSEPTPNPVASTEASNPRNEVATTPAAPKRRKWTRRLLKTLFALALAFLVFRIGLFFLLAFTLRKVANFYDLDLTYERQEITLLGGDAGLWGVNISRRGDAQPFLVADYVHGNLSVLALLRTNIEILRMEADGVTLDLTRTADGRVPLMELVAAQLSGQPVTPQAQASPEPVQLESPFKIDALRVHRFRTKVTDLAVTPPFRETLYADLRVSDLRHPLKPTSIEADVWSDSVLTAMRFYGSGTARGQKVDLNADFRGGGLNLQPIAQYLQPLGLNPVARAIDWTGKLKLTTDAGPTPASIKANLAISDVSASADSREVVAVKAIDVAARSIDPAGIALSTLRVDGVHVRADRATNGRLQFAGIELAAPPAAPQPATVPASPRRVLTPITPPATRPATTPTTRLATAPAFITLDEFVLTGVEATFGDAALSQPATIQVFVDELKTRQIGRDEQGRSFLPVDGKVRAPGIADTVSLAGRVYPFNAPFGADMQISAQGVQLDALKPYLEPLGITSTLSNAQFTAGVNGAVELLNDGSAEASLLLQDVVLQDASERLKLPLVALSNLRANPTNNRFELGEVSIVGPEMSVVRGADGYLEALGFRYQHASNSQTPSAETEPKQLAEEWITLNPPLPDNLPIIKLQKLDWRGVKIVVEDRSTAEPSRFVVDDIGAELKGIVFNLSRDSSVFGNGEIRAWASLPGLLGRIDVTGDTSSSSGDFRTRVNLMAKQIDLTPLAPYLAPLGLKPTMSDGNFEASAHLELLGISDSIRHEIITTVGGSIELRDGQEWLLSVPMVQARGVTLHPTWIDIDTIETQAAQLRLFRNFDDSLEACGLQLAAPVRTEAPAPAGSGPLVTIPRLPIPIVIQSISLSAFSALIEDRTFDPPLQTGVSLAGHVGNLRIDQRPGATRPEHAAGFGLTIFLGEDDETEIGGSFRLERDSFSAEAEVRGTKLTSAPLLPYLPPNIVPTFEGAALGAKAEISIRNLDAQSQQVDVAVRDVSVLHGEETLAKLDEFAIKAAKIDPAGNRIDIDAIQVRGASARAGLGKDSSVRLPGVRIDPAVESVKEVTPPQAQIEVAADGAPLNADEMAQRLEAARKPLPLVTIKKLDIGVDRAGLALDTLGPNSEVALEALRLSNVEPIQIGGKDAATLPPVKLKLQTALSPLARSVSLDLQAAPFATETSLAAALDVSGIEGNGLVNLVPELSAWLDGAAMTQGSFKGSVDAKLRVPRRTPTELDFTRGFDGDVSLSGIEYRVSVDEEPRAGVESITVEGLRVQPAFGGGSVKLLTVNKPRAHVWRDANGIQVLGWTIKLPSSDASTQPTDTQAGREAKTVSPPSAAKANPPTELGPEFKIDRLLVSGVDFLARDDSVSPPLVVPINSLDVEVKGLSNRALVQDRTIRFSALVGADKVELPTRVRRGEPATAATEMRPLLSQVTATGTLKLYPALDGYVKAAVNGFEMQSLAGEARTFGITLGDGIFDGSFDARFRDGGNLDLKTKLVVTDLKLSEQPNGLLQRTFTPGTPIDAAIGFAEDAGGSITFPLSARIQNGELNMGSVIGSVIGGVSQVMLTAVASAPAKVLQGMFGGGEKDVEPAPPVVLTFLPGDASLEPALRSELDRLIESMRRDQDLVVTLSHRLSAADAARAGVLASPTREQIQQMTGELRTRRLSLINERSTRSAQLTAQIASGQDGSQQMDVLRELDRQIVANDDALDRLLEQTRPGAELQADRRMKAAALEVATARLSAVRAYLEGAKLPRGSERMSVTNSRFEVDPSLSSGGSVWLQTTGKKRAN